MIGELPPLRGCYSTHYPLLRHNTWRVGGAAEHCYRPADTADLVTFFRRAEAPTALYTWLGLGSNVLVPDAGVRGTVIMTTGGLAGLSFDAERCIVRAEAGVPCAKVAKFCVKQGLGGGAFFAGIPGTIGGALAMNAGAFGAETWSSVVEVETINTEGMVRVRHPEEYRIAYRSVIGPDFPGTEAFLAGLFRFPRAISQHVQENIRMCLRRRAETQPIGTWNCGSVFRNPEGGHAARLIEACGLKGERIGGAEVSSKHANFIINKGQATAQDIRCLIASIQDQVWQQHEVRLEPEVRFL